MDQVWRRKAVKLAELKATDRIVDVACGTGDLIAKFREAGDLIGSDFWLDEAGWHYLGIDFTFEMLPIARRKESSNDLVSMIHFVNGDAQALPLPDGCCDVVSIAFGIRNVQDPAKALAEFRRVLRPGGRVIVLEFSLPTHPVARGLYNFYFRNVLPRTATLVSGDKTGAYKYLPESVNTFIGRQQMVQMMTAASFDQVEQHPMTLGVCVCYRGVVREEKTPQMQTDEHR